MGTTLGRLQGKQAKKTPQGFLATSAIMPEITRKVKQQKMHGYDATNLEHL
jgi:hypothetical protein